MEAQNSAQSLGDTEKLLTTQFTAVNGLSR
jgi:hypothetical protein